MCVAPPFVYSYPRLKPRTAIPQDVDIVVSAGDFVFTAESIKERIVEEDDRYFLKPSGQHGATHQILYCRLPGWWTNGRCVKVDILVPPTLGLPEVQSYDTVIINDIPVMPLFDLLVMKTQGWWDHRISPRADFQAKQNNDVDDINALLDCADTVNLSYDDEIYRHEQKFIDNALILVRRFVQVYRGRGQWRRLGFPVYKTRT
jgi:hypothetical protein